MCTAAGVSGARYLRRLRTAGGTGGEGIVGESRGAGTEFSMGEEALVGKSSFGSGTLDEVGEAARGGVEERKGRVPGEADEAEEGAMVEQGSAGLVWGFVRGAGVGGDIVEEDGDCVCCLLLAGAGMCESGEAEGVGEERRGWADWGWDLKGGFLGVGGGTSGAGMMEETDRAWVCGRRTGEKLLCGEEAEDVGTVAG